MSQRRAGEWSPPIEVANGFCEDGARQSCYNPVLCQVPNGPLMLFYKVGIHPTLWKGFLKTSVDGGETWSEARSLPDGIIGPDKNKPLQLADGSLLCGTSTETDGWRVHFELTADLGLTWTKTPSVNDGGEIDAIQPSILSLGGDRLLAMGRTRQQRMFEVASEDSGRTWGPMSLTGIPNPNSGTDALTLHDGRHLLVYNHSARRRRPLVAAISADSTAWNAEVILERGAGEFSYPACIQTSDGMVHITYTWNRERIRHVTLDPRR